MTQSATELWTSWTRHRDERSFGALVRSELPHALGFAQRLGCSTADAEDAVQDALARLVAVRDDAPMALGLRAWLCREVHVRARSLLRSERRRRTREAATVVAGASAPPDSALEVREEVERALAGLDEDERAAVQLRYLHDLDYREMAVVLATSEGACRKRVHRAIERLRARFGDDAAAVVAALPLPAVRDVSLLLKRALAKAAVSSAAAGGVMATTAQKIVVVAVAASALGVAGTLAAQHAIAPEAPGENVLASPVVVGELKKRDAEISRLRTQLADAVRRRSSAPSPVEVSPETKPVATAQSAPRPTPQSAPPPPIDSAALDAVARAKADILQIEDAARRERGLTDLGEAMRSTDPLVAAAAFSSLARIRDVTYDKHRFRPQVLDQIENRNDTIRRAALYALLQVAREPGDVDRVLAVGESTPLADGGHLGVAMWMSDNRVEGRLEKLFVRALATDETPRSAMDIANYLRGTWTSPTTEDAVVAAWRRRACDEGQEGLWPYIFGQMQPAARESRVRAIFEMIASGDDAARQLTERAITTPVDDSARPIAAQLAAAGLATAPTAELRRTYLGCLRANGARADVAVLHAFAENQLVGEDLRKLACEVADALDRGTK